MAAYREPKPVYFIENKITKEWFVHHHQDYTNDPLKAKQFETDIKAFEFILSFYDNDLEWKYSHEITEHLFNENGNLLAYIKEPGFKVGDFFYYHSNEPKDIRLCRYTKEDLKHSGQKGSIDNFVSHYQEGQQINPEKFRYVKEVKVLFQVKYEWQEVKEPEKSDFHELEDGIPSFEIEKYRAAMEQFHQECREGTILLEEKN